MQEQRSVIKKRKPILAAFLSLITSGLGQVYNGELLNGTLLNIVLCVAAFLYSLRIFLDGTTDLAFFAAITLVFIGLKIYSIVQAFAKSRQFDRAYHLRKFNSVYFYVAFTIVFLFLFIAPGQIIKELALKDISGSHPFRSAKAKERYLKFYDQAAKIWPLASETRMVDTSYGQTFVRICGPEGAPPLVLIHGANATSLMWAPNITALSERYRTYAVDNIYDPGRSVFTRKIKTSNDFTNWLDELFNRLELGDHISLIGQSYGGWIVSQYTLRFPGRLEKSVWLAPAGAVLPFRAEFLGRGLLSTLPLRYFSKSMMFWLLADMVHKDEASRRLAEDFVDYIYEGQTCFKPKMLVNPTLLTDAELRSIKVPTLFLVGENEKIYSAEKALRRLNRVAPQIRAEIIPGAGHDLTVVQAELVNRKILEFLDQPRR
jgi:pimeloyl-ACP methyl ester carboxylesterase